MLHFSTRRHKMKITMILIFAFVALATCQTGTRKPFSYTPFRNQIVTNQERYRPAGNAQYKGSADGQYTADDSGSYKHDGQYYHDDSGKYVHIDSKYDHLDSKYQHIDHSYEHTPDKFGKDGNNHGASGGNGGSGAPSGNSFASGSRLGSGFGSGSGSASLNKKPSSNAGVGSGFGGGLAGAAGSSVVVSGGHRTPQSSGGSIGAAAGFGEPVVLQQGSASGKYDNRNYNIIRKVEHVEEDGYHYLYETENGILAEEQGKLANRGTDNEAMQASGYFTYTGPDNVIYTVKYTANEDGFVPEAAHIPTPPPIPDAILRALEYQRSIGTL